MKEAHGPKEIEKDLTCAVIVTTYNWPEALGLALSSILRQSRKPEEVIVADDGSGPQTAQAVKRVLGPTQQRWCHVRHEDKGIRQARIKNLAVKYSCASYLLFIDHDVVLHPDFVFDHLSNAEPDLFLQGKRCFLSKDRSRIMLDDGFSVAPSPLSRGLENRKNAFRCPKLGRFLSRAKGFQESLRGCNLSMPRKHFLEVDGYDEVFDQLWGREDSDICYRLFHSDVKIRNLWFSALQYHLHHDVRKQEEKDRLDRELERNLKEERKRAVKGYSRLSGEGGIIDSSVGF
jgi:glycosyltransferase involved in cell wall biosynthesis